VVVADDLMWSTRITESIRRAGGSAIRLSTLGELAIALEAADLGEDASISGAIVDLNGRRYDGISAIERVNAARLPVIAVAQHDDQVTRKRALKAGATRVFSYDKFFRDGTHLVAAWIGPGEATADADPSR
jgi:DNA-binding response OmpR family regulator